MASVLGSFMPGMTSQQQPPKPPDMHDIFPKHIALLQKHLYDINELGQQLLASGADHQNPDILALQEMANRTLAAIEDASRIQQAHLTPQSSFEEAGKTTLPRREKSAAPHANIPPRKPTNYVAKRRVSNSNAQDAVPHSAEPPSKKSRQLVPSIDTPAKKKDYANPYEVDTNVPAVAAQDDFSSVVEERLRIAQRRREQRLENPDTVRAPSPIIGVKRPRVSDGSLHEPAKKVNESTRDKPNTSVPTSSVSYPNLPTSTTTSTSKTETAQLPPFKRAKTNADDPDLPRRKNPPTHSYLDRKRAAIRNRLSAFSSDVLSSEAGPAPGRKAPLGTLANRFEALKQATHAEEAKNEMLRERMARLQTRKFVDEAEKTEAVIERMKRKMEEEKREIEGVEKKRKVVPWV